MNELNSISNIIKEAKKVFNPNSQLWFRGHSKSEYKLLPSIFRIENKDIDESSIYHEFIRRFPNHSNTHRTVTDWLTLMQHYGLPTRLLDWTSNLLVALYFTCKDNKDIDGSLYIYSVKSNQNIDIDLFLEFQVYIQNQKDMYDRLLEITNNKRELYSINSQPTHLQLDIFEYQNLINSSLLSILEENLLYPQNKISTDTKVEFYGHEIIDNLSDIINIYPPILNDRLKLQHGFFTYHGGKTIGDDKLIKYIPMDEHEWYKDEIHKIVIKKEYKKQLLDELELSGIKESVLFPEMEYQVKDIRKMFSNKTK